MAFTTDQNHKLDANECTQRFFVLTGEPGSGKSTLIAALQGLDMRILSKLDEASFRTNWLSEAVRCQPVICFCQLAPRRLDACLQAEK
jgi:energy-coupling factor transporter ATP-binding protein EcfA2